MWPPRLCAHTHTHIGRVEILLHCPTRAQFLILFAPFPQICPLQICSIGAIAERHFNLFQPQKLIQITVINTRLRCRLSVIDSCPATLFHILRSERSADVQPPVPIA